MPSRSSSESPRHGSRPAATPSSTQSKTPLPPRISPRTRRTTHRRRRGGHGRLTLKDLDPQVLTVSRRVRQPTHAGDVGQRELPPREPDLPSEPVLLNLPVGLTGIRALVVAVLDYQVRRGEALGVDGHRNLLVAARNLG